MSNANFDYIIIGAGSAGCVLAEQLSEDPSLKILLVEAGPADKNPLFHIPIGWAEVAYSQKCNWGYLTAPEKGIADRPMIWPRAKVLGGCSSTNGLVIVRGQAKDYDDWAAQGNEGWSWEEVLPYFKKCETYHPGGDETRGTAGRLNVNKPRQSVLSEYFLDACQTMGTPRVDDTNTGDQFGAGYSDVNIHKGRRQSTADCFLRPALKRSNLTLMTDTEVEELIFNGITVEGVKLNHKGKTLSAMASGEVILAAGAINSPLLLEKSGIGQAERLATLGIPCRHELNGVGENLHDHLGVMMSYHVTLKETINDTFTLGGIINHLWQFLRRKEGLLSYPSADVIAFMKSSPELDRPDLQVHFTPASGTRNDKGKSVMDKVSGVTAMVYPTRPTSRGSVHMSMGDAPMGADIRPNYLTTDEDKDKTLKGLKLLRDIFNAEPFAQVVHSEIRPGADCVNDEALMQYAAETSITSYHPVGTCKMGHDDMAVVDSQLRVHGMKNLRIVDASVMPSICSGNTNAATMMIAMKAADLIRASR